MSKRKFSEEIKRTNKIRKIEVSLDSKNDTGIYKEMQIPDLSRVNIDEIENTIFEAVKRNNFSNAKAKYLIKQMLKHPSVVEWFRNIFSTENHDFNLSYEPRVTRAARRRVDLEDSAIDNELTAGLIGRLILSAPTITSADFDNEDCTDTDYFPDNDQSDSEISSITSVCLENEYEIKQHSPYITRSKYKIDDLQVDLIDDSEVMPQETDIITHDSNMMYYNPGGDVFLEEIQNFMETDVEEQLYDEFKRSLNMNIFDNVEDDPEFDVFAQISELDEDIFDDCRNDRSVKIPKSELWALLKDNKLVDGNENSTSNKKTITLLCKSESTTDKELNDTEATQLFESHSLHMGKEQTIRLERQISMFYQMLATNFIMLYDQSNFAQLVASQIDLYFKMASNVVTNGEESVFNPSNRIMVENILFNYKGMNYIPHGRFNMNVNFKKITFPKCLIATLLCSPAFPYQQLLPTSFKLYNTQNSTMFRVVPFLASEDKLLMHGIIQFGHQSHKMLKLLQRYLFPIRTTEQLRYRKTNILRRHKDLNYESSSMLVELLQFSKGSSMKVCSELSKVPFSSNAIWQRQDEWQYLPEVYLKFLKRTVPEIMLNLNLYDKEEYSRSKRCTTFPKSQPEKNVQYCNWNFLPWEMHQIPNEKTITKRPCLKSTLRKIVKEKSFPQYEIPIDSNFRKQLRTWNCYLDKKKSRIQKNKRYSKPSKSSIYICTKKLVKKSKRIILNTKCKTSKITQQSYAHYFRNEDTEKLFPETLFRCRLEEITKNRNQKSFRFLKFKAKCNVQEREMMEVFAPFSSSSDEDDLIFCRNLLNNMQHSLNSEHYEKCLKLIYNFDLECSNSDFDRYHPELEEYILVFIRSILELIKTSDDNADLYEDFISLLTPLQAVKLGLEIEYNKIKNYNKLYLMTKYTSNGKNRRFWSRFSSLMTKFKNGSCSLSKLIHYITNNFKHNPYLQSMIAPLLNCWQTPYPNFPETFTNIDFLSSKESWLQFQANAETDNWEYCDDLSTPPKNACECSCHDHTLSKESSIVKHCSKCSIKVSNGSIYLDEGRFHKRLVRIKWPSDFQQNISENLLLEVDEISRTTKTENQSSMSVLDFLRSRNTKNVHLHNRSISLKHIFYSSEVNVHPDNTEVSCLNYNQVLRDDEAAMDVETFRLIKGTQGDQVYGEEFILPNDTDDLKLEPFSFNLKSTITWTDKENMLLLTECQMKGPSKDTFEYLNKCHFLERTCAEIENQFNHLYEQLLKHHGRSEGGHFTQC